MTFRGLCSFDCESQQQMRERDCESQQQITFHRNGAHKDWETVGNMCLQENDK